MSEHSFLAQLQNVFENAYGIAEQFRARDFQITDFDHMSDEDTLAAEEKQLSETLEIESFPESQDLHEEGRAVNIAAIDTSSLILGETDQGLALAIRGAVVVQKAENFENYTFGPYVAHITRTNMVGIYSELRRALGMTESEREPSSYKLPDRIRNMVERLAQRYANSLISNSIVLWDGALTRSMDTPRQVFQRSFLEAENRSNHIISVTKETRLWLTSGKRLLEVFEGGTGSQICEIPLTKIRTNAADILGNVHVVKFTDDGFSFRVDVKQCSGNCCDVLRLLKASCHFRYGYPEPLCRAHINCFFTPADALALQGMFASRHKLRILPAFNLRTYVFGPFGG